jgi:hypothetical protein
VTRTARQFCFCKIFEFLSICTDGCERGAVPT